MAKGKATPAQVGAAAMARFGMLQRKIATEYPHHIFSHSSVQRLDGRMCRPLTEEERATPEIITEDREFFAAVILWAQAGKALADLRARNWPKVLDIATQGQIGEAVEEDDGGEDF